MRNFIGALSVLVLITGAVIWNSHHMSTITGKAALYLDSALSAESRQDSDAAVQAAKELAAYWKAQRSYLESVLMHNELDEIEETISAFLSAAKTDDYETFCASGDLLYIQFSHLCELEQWRIGNIL